MLGGLSGLLGGVGSVLHGVHGVANDLLETVSPGSTEGQTTIGNLVNENGLLGDLINGIEDGDLIGGVADSYGNIVGPGGAINNLAAGGGLGIEGLLGNVLGAADGVLGEDGLLGGVLGDGGLLDGGLLGSDGGLLDGVLDGGLLG